VGQKIEAQPLLIAETAFQPLDVTGSHEGHAGIEEGGPLADQEKRRQFGHSDGAQPLRDFSPALNNHGNPLYDGRGIFPVLEGVNHIQKEPSNQASKCRRKIGAYQSGSPPPCVYFFHKWIGQLCNFYPHEDPLRLRWLFSELTIVSLIR
jgi:hypothetical protein